MFGLGDYMRGGGDSGDGAAYGNQAFGSGAQLAWYLDTGASYSCCPYRELFTKIRFIDDGPAIQVADGTRHVARAVGNVSMHGQYGTWQLQNVMFMPDFSQCLVSASMLIAQGIVPTLNPQTNTFYLICQHAQRCVDSAPVSNGVYPLSSRAQPAAARLVLYSPTKAQRWHARFGHLNTNDLQRLCTERMVDGLPLTGKQVRSARGQRCDACQRANQPRCPHPPTYSLSPAPLDMLFMDICGPMPVQSIGGARYLLAVIDDHSKYAFVMPLRSKADAAAMLRTLITRLNVQCPRRVQRLRSDRGGEFVAGQLTAFCDAQGIEQQFTSTYSSQQNGTVERYGVRCRRRCRPSSLRRSFRRMPGRKHLSQPRMCATAALQVHLAPTSAACRARRLNAVTARVRPSRTCASTAPLARCGSATRRLAAGWPRERSPAVLSVTNSAQAILAAHVALAVCRRTEFRCKTAKCRLAAKWCLTKLRCFSPHQC